MPDTEAVCVVEEDCVPYPLGDPAGDELGALVGDGSAVNDRPPDPVGLTEAMREAVVETLGDGEGNDDCDGATVREPDPLVDDTGDPVGRLEGDVAAVMLGEEEGAAVREPVPLREGTGDPVGRLERDAVVEAVGCGDEEKRAVVVPDPDACGEAVELVVGAVEEEGEEEEEMEAMELVVTTGDTVGEPDRDACGEPVELTDSAEEDETVRVAVVDVLELADANGEAVGDPDGDT